jgi:hypothetical protein
VNPRTAWVAAGSLARRSGPNPGVVGEWDAACAAEAQRIQASRRGWLVMWSPWHRTYTAFCCLSPDHSRPLDAATTDELVREMRRVELRYAPTRFDLPAVLS